MFIIHQQWKGCVSVSVWLASLSLIPRFWPCISTGRCCAVDLHTDLKAACGDWDTWVSSSGAAKTIIQPHPLPPAAPNTNWFHLRPQRAWIKVCEAWLHRACTIYTRIPPSVSVISVRCKTIMTPFHHSTVCSTVIGGLTDQTHRYQHSISNTAFNLKWNKYFDFYSLACRALQIICHLCPTWIWWSVWSSLMPQGA